MRHNGLASRDSEYRVTSGAPGGRDVPDASVESAPAADPWTFVGRDCEVQFIAGRVSGPQPRSVVVAGAAGVGKTRLAREALVAARRSGRPTRWVAGTHSAAAIPLGAFAHLLPAIDTGSDPLAMLQRAGAAVADGSGQRLVVGIDDAHLLDELSVTLVHQLALTGAACLVLTARTGEPAPEAVVTLWKDGLADRLELRPLPRAEADRLVTAVLGAVVDSRTCERLWRASLGNPLFLRELVDGGRQTGRLRQQDGVWRWVGSIEPTPRLYDIVAARLGGLDAGERAALELLATGEPLGLGRLADLTHPDVVAGLERKNLVVVENSGWRAQAWLAHPSYGAVLRAQLPEADACQLRRRLAHAYLPWQRQDDLLRAGTLLLDSDEPGAHATLLADAAGRANAALDHDLAARMARAAIEGGSGVQAHLSLLEALRWQGRSDEAVQVAMAAEPLASVTRHRCRLVVGHALTLFFGLGKLVTAETMLQQAVMLQARDAGADEETGRYLGAIRGVLAFFAGRSEEVAEFVADSGAPAGVWESCAAAVRLAAHGRTAAALVAVACGRAVLERRPIEPDPMRPDSAEPELALARLVLAHGELSALMSAGRIGEAETRAAELHRWCLTQAAWAGDAVAAAHLGWSALAAGRPQDALRWLTEAATGLAQRDPSGCRQLCIALQAQAHAQLGDTASARQALDGGPPHHPRVFVPETLLAEAWLAAADQDIDQALDQAMRAALVAADMGHRGVQAHALHTAVRLGRAAGVAARLRQLAEQVDGILVATYSAHAEAARADSGEALDEVVARFEAIGAVLLAAEAAAHAASAHERAGSRRRAAASAARAAGLARACGPVRTPALEQLAPPPLTSREDEVANLVVQGLNNQAIAKRLVLSVRTVEAHLANAYAKLGISSRTQLAEVLGADLRSGALGTPVSRRHPVLETTSRSATAQSPGRSA